MDQATETRAWIYSRLAGDPDLSDIVKLFVEEMPGRVANLRQQLDVADWEGLRRTAHQLRGAAGSYGFDMISPGAARVECAVCDGECEARIRAAVEELIELCNCARCGAPA